MMLFSTGAERGVNVSETTSDVILGGSTHFGTFFRAEFTNMVALAEAVCGDPSAAEDIAAEAMSKAHDRWAKIGGYDKPATWVRRVTINMAHSHGRRLSTRRKFLRAQRSEPAATLAERDDELWAAVAKLAPKQRSAIALHYLEDLSVAEIAEVLECTVSTATSHLHNGRKKLATLLTSSASPATPSHPTSSLPTSSPDDASGAER